MNLETTEVTDGVETGAADAAGTVDSGVAETAVGEATNAGESAGTGVEQVETADGGSASSDIDLDGWNGELDSIHKTDWWERVPEEIRPAISTGIKKKYSAFHKGYTAKERTLQDSASQRFAAAEALKSEAIALQKQVNDLLSTGADPGDVLKQQAEELRQEIQRMKDEAEEARQAALEEATKPWQEKESQWSASKKEMEKELQELREYKTSITTKEAEDARDYVLDTLQKDHNHLFNNDDAFDFVSRLLAADTFKSLDEIIEIANVKFPAPVSEEEKKKQEEAAAEEPPAGVTGMHLGPGRVTDDKNLGLYTGSFADMRRALDKHIK